MDGIRLRANHICLTLKGISFLIQVLVRKGWVGRRTSNCLDLRPSHDYLLIAQLLKIHLQCRRPQFDSWLVKIRWRKDRLPTLVFLGLPCGSAGEESACSVGDLGSIPGLGRSPGEGTATHSSILAWRIPWTVPPQWSQSSSRVGACT